MSTLFASVAISLPCLRLCVVRTDTSRAGAEAFSQLGMMTLAAVTCVRYGWVDALSVTGACLISFLFSDYGEASTAGENAHIALSAIACMAMMWQLRRAGRQVSLWAQCLLAFVAAAPTRLGQPTRWSTWLMIASGMLFASTSRHLFLSAVAVCLFAGLAFDLSTSALFASVNHSWVVVALVVLLADRPQYPKALAVAFFLAAFPLPFLIGKSPLRGLDIGFAVTLVAMLCYSASRMKAIWTHGATYIIFLIAIASSLMEPTVSSMAVTFAAVCVLLSVGWERIFTRPSTASALLFCASVYGTVGGSDWSALVALVAWGVPAVLLADSPRSPLAWAVSVPLVAYGAADHLVSGPLSMALTVHDNGPAAAIDIIFAALTVSFSGVDSLPERLSQPHGAVYVLFCSVAVLFFQRGAVAARRRLQWTWTATFVSVLIVLIVCVLQIGLQTPCKAGHSVICTSELALTLYTYLLALWFVPGPLARVLITVSFAAAYLSATPEEVVVTAVHSGSAGVRYGEPQSF